MTADTGARSAAVAPQPTGFAAMAQPADGLAQPADGLAQPADGLAQPADGLVPLADGLAQPADGLVPLADGLGPLADTDWSEPTISSTSAVGADAEDRPGRDGEGGEAGEQRPAEQDAGGEGADPNLPQPGPEPAAAASADEPLVPAATPGRHGRARHEAGATPAWHAQLVERAADAAVVAMPIPLRVLDVGCGDGRLLAELAIRVPYAELCVGLDPAPEQVSPALLTAQPTLSVVCGVAEALPFPDACFDLVVTMLSLAHWRDPRAGMAELARVVSDNGKVVVVEATKGRPAGKDGGTGVKEITELIESVGLEVERVETVHRSLLQRPLASAFIAAP